MAKDSIHESLISREALMAEVSAELSIADMKNSRTKSATYRKVLDLIASQKEYGKVNPTAVIFFGG